MRPWLLQVKILGVIAFLGGLLALACFGLLGPKPETLDGWQLVKGTLRAVFYPTVFAGLVIAVGSGIALWLQHPQVFLKQRWFKLKGAALVVFVPGCHLWARGRVTRFYVALEAERMDALPGLWQDVATAFAVSFGIFFALACIGRVKPRLGKPIAVANPETAKWREASVSASSR